MKQEEIDRIAQALMNFPGCKEHRPGDQIFSIMVSDLYECLSQLASSSIDLNEVEKLVQACTKLEIEESQPNPNAERDAEYLRQRIGYTLQDLTARPGEK